MPIRGAGRMRAQWVRSQAFITANDSPWDGCSARSWPVSPTVRTVRLGLPEK